MSLTGRPFLALLIILTIGLPVTTVVFWSHVRSGLLAFLARGFGVFASQLVAVLLAAVIVNNYGFFYSSWTDVFTSSEPISSTSNSTHPPAPGKGGTTAGGISTMAYPSYSAPSQWNTKGRIDSVTIAGANTGMTSPAYVYLPPQYFQPAYAHKNFPGVEVFTGYPGNATSLVERMRYPEVLLKEILRHRARPMVLVMMRPSVNFPRDTECTDVPAGPQALTFFAQDVTAQISRHYRVRPTGWGAMGDSTGGYCSVKLAMLQPAIFPAAVALSGYYNTLKDNTTGDLWGGSLVLRKLNDLLWRLKNMPAPAVSLLVTTSRDENGPEGHLNTAAFLRLVKPPLVVDSIIQRHGGHNFATWAGQMPTALSWLSKKLPPAQAR